MTIGAWPSGSSGDERGGGRMTKHAPSLLHPLPDAGAREVFTTLLSRPGARVERIVSQGQITPEDAPYCQDWDEWVLLLAGGARLWLADEGEVALAPGEHLLIPAGTAHRVVWSDPACPTIWLAIHFAA